MRKTASIEEAIAAAEAILPGVAAPDDKEDPRWQAIIEVGNYLDEAPEQVWQFIERWGGHEDQDLRAAIGCCLLEELLPDHFENFFPRVEVRAHADALFADMFHYCAVIGPFLPPEHREQLNVLIKQTGGIVIHCRREDGIESE